MRYTETTGDVQTDYYYDESGNVFGFKRGNSEYYYIRNGQGDIIGILDSSGTQIVSYVYDSWGKLVSVTDASGNDKSGDASFIGNLNPFRYRGYYYDTETGLYYLQSRYYDPEVGRFLNADGLLGANGDILAYNLLAYCGNNPVNLSDPTGEVAASTIVLCASILIAATAETFSPAGQERVQKAINEPSFYNITNQLTLGALDTFKGTFAPEEPLSLQHWVDSANTAFMLLPPLKRGVTLIDALQYNRMQRPSLLSVVSACFIAGTVIQTEDGLRNIEDIKVGDLVWAKDTESGEIGLKTVVKTFERETDELVNIKVQNETITTTPEHPFYVPQKGWTSAIDLRAGDMLCLLSGEIVVIEVVQHEILENPVKVYNFEVEDFHTYYVGYCSVLVHNQCFTRDQQALLALGKEAQMRARSGHFISLEEALILDQWAREYGIPQHHGAYLGSGQHWSLGWDHTHLFGKHIPFK